VHPASTSVPAAARDEQRLQYGTLGILSVTQMIGGTGLAMGIAVGAPLAARIGGTVISGVSQSAAVIGTALIAMPAPRLMNARGRRPGLGGKRRNTMFRSDQTCRRSVALAARGSALLLAQVACGQQGAVLA
jgi:hypothetical protein